MPADRLASPSFNQQQQQGKKDCLSCRLTGGLVQLGFSAFVASHYPQMGTPTARAFIVTVSSGEREKERDIFLNPINGVALFALGVLL